MNEKFLARGKREDTKAWVEGYLIEQNSPEYHAYIIQSFKAEIDNRHIDILECDIEEVIPETVESYTGLTDKNGKKIFEGDIVEVIGEDSLAKIYWCENIAKFILDFYNEDFISDFDSYYGKECEVIGNIHDNPELLK